MCLAVCGEILTITDLSPPAVLETGAGAAVQTPGAIPVVDPLWRVAEVDFGGVRQQVSLACLPQARVGDRVLVHVGLALSVVEPDGEAARLCPGP
ncbi:MAG: HypC/HybG/HupF family hydrogenase formation chaperone [Cyanobium sp.]